MFYVAAVTCNSKTIAEGLQKVSLYSNHCVKENAWVVSESLLWRCLARTFVTTSCGFGAQILHPPLVGIESCLDHR